MHMNVVILIFADYFLYLDGTDIVFVVAIFIFQDINLCS